MRKNILHGIGLLFTEKLRDSYQLWQDTKAMLPQDDWFDELLRQSIIGETDNKKYQEQLKTIERLMAQYLISWYEVMLEEGTSVQEAREEIQGACTKWFPDISDLYNQVEGKLQG